MVTALVLSGGTGTRMGSSMPKQYIEVGGRPVISYCIKTLSKSDRIDAIWIVAALEWQENIHKWISDFGLSSKFRGFSAPGANRQLSVYNGIRDIKDMLSDTEYVLIHDAARPMITEADIENCITAVPGHDGVLPVLPMKDTVYVSNDGTTVTGLLERSRIFAGQAPEVFVLEKYLKANEQLLNRIESNGCEKPESPQNSAIMKINGSTEPAVMAGMDIVMIPGNEDNFKITTMTDLERFKTIVEQNSCI